MITIPNSSGDVSGYDFAIGGKGVVTTNDPTTHLEVGTTAAGTGNVTAANGDVLSIVYTGYLTNGTIFDSTVIEGGAPLTFRLDNTTGRLYLMNDQSGVVGVDQNVIDGWETGLQGIKLGEKRTLIIPASMGYGANGTTGIPGNATLIFDVQVSGIAYSPELGVRGNGVSITNGTTTTNGSDGTNFGSLTLGQTQIMHSFNLLDFSEQTTSSGSLVTGISISSITLTGANPSDFVLSLGTGSVLNVTFKPTLQGLRSAVVNIFSNDPNAPDFTFTVQGTVPPVDLTATLGNVKYPAGGLVTGSGNITLPVVVHNMGFGTVSGSNTTADITISAQGSSGEPMILRSVNENLKGLSTGKTKTFNINVVVPAGMAEGSYTLIAEVDSQSLIAEGNYTNNSVSTANISIASGFDNITGSLVSTTIPAAVVSGAAINGAFTVSVKNAGNLNLPKGQQATIKVIAHNTDTGANITLYTSPAESLSALAAGASKPMTLTLKNAPGLAAGNYTYETLITPVQALTESSTADNLITTTAANGTLGVTSAQAFVDLTGALGTSSLVSSATGVKGKMSVTAKNIGNAALPAGQTIQLQIIAHPQGEGDVLGDIVLQTSPVLSVKNWKAGQTGSFSVSVADVNALAGGTYDIEAKIVPVVALSESDTGNNLVTENAGGQAVTLVSTNA